MRPSISAIIITKNEELMLANCLEALQWCSEIIVVDSDSEDQTVGIAERAGAKVIASQTHSFSEKRNIGKEAASSEWVFYIDADERVTPRLAKEILVQTETSTANALVFHRQNMMYGKVFQSGGWQSEFITRVFRLSALEKWQGDIHESPVFTGESVQLHSSLVHLTHRNTVDGLLKSASWTPIEARLLYESSVAPVSFMTLLRKGSMEFFRRAVLKKGYQDGLEGLIEALVQAINRILVYIQVWELQQKPSLAEKYQRVELEINNQWKSVKPEDLSPVLAVEKKELKKDEEVT